MHEIIIQINNIFNCINNSSIGFPPAMVINVNIPRLMVVV